MRSVPPVCFGVDQCTTILCIHIHNIYIFLSACVQNNMCKQQSHATGNFEGVLWMYKICMESNNLLLSEMYTKKVFKTMHLGSKSFLLIHRVAFNFVKSMCDGERWQHTRCNRLAVLIFLASSLVKGLTRVSSSKVIWDGCAIF